MKTYLSAHTLTAVFQKTDHFKRFFTCAVTSVISISLLANTAPHNISLDTNHVISTGTDHLINLPVNSGSLIAGNNDNGEFSLPLVMTAFKAVLNDDKVVLTWTTGLEKKLSHFVIEKSTDGKDYKDAAIIFAVTTSSAKQNYSYTESISMHTRGILYYRIKIVDPTGKFQTSAVKVIRVDDEPEFATVETYPNPVVNEVRITIPSKWQNQQVMYELYNAGGLLVKRVVSNNANQTEVLNMQNCSAGLYVVKTSTRSESKAQSIFKK